MIMCPLSPSGGEEKKVAFKYVNGTPPRVGLAGAGDKMQGTKYL
jgi:hypothetical protein